MKRSWRMAPWTCLLMAGVGLLWPCPFDTTLREYLGAQFWAPFAKSAEHFIREGVPRTTEAYAGMEPAAGQTPLAKLRSAYQEIAVPEAGGHDTAKVRQALAAARADAPLTAREREETARKREEEEVDLLDAKIDMRAASAGNPEPLQSAKQKLTAFLAKAKTPAYRSEARGWLARVHFLLGDRTAAGKIYLDELNRNGSNLSQENVLTSLRIVYVHDGRAELPAHLDQYFDTPEHAAFAIQLVTNPHWVQEGRSYFDGQTVTSPVRRAPPYAQIRNLLQRHSAMLRSGAGANALAILGMRAALHVGDPAAALRLADEVPANAAVRTEPDYQWMLASAHFLTRQYAAAEPPLLLLLRNTRASENQNAAAAYALCGVYQKTGNAVEQIRFALWLHTKNVHVREHEPGFLADQSIYWATSGFDLSLLLDAEAPIEALRAFLTKYPTVPDVRLVKYSLAVRLARDNQYDESARIYQDVNQLRRAPRMLRMSELHREANRADLPRETLLEAKYKLAEFLAANPERIYFNDALWSRLQRYALYGERDSRLTREERERQIALERKLKDDQEELWRAHLILREVVRDAGQTELGRRAAGLAIRCLRRISDRFGRESEIRSADLELSTWLTRARPAT